MLSEVGSVDAGQPYSRRTSLSDSTPASRARCHDAQRASGSARRRSPGFSATNRRKRVNAVFLIVMVFRSLSVIGIAWAPHPANPSLSWLRDQTFLRPLVTGYSCAAYFNEWPSRPPP
jgi:hypothetical protein